MFSMLCIFFAYPFRLSAFSDRKRKSYFLLIACSGIAYGVLMEFVQKYWVANRSFELWDIVADSTGCVLGLIISCRKFLHRG